MTLTASLTGTVDAYICMSDDYTHQLADVVTEISRASKKSLSLLTSTNERRAAVKEQYEVGTDQYEAAMDDIDHDYQFELAKINAWESDLESQKEQLQMNIQATNGFKDSFQGFVKQGASTDLKYGGSGGS